MERPPDLPQNSQAPITENLHQLRMALALVEQRLKRLAGESSGQVAPSAPEAATQFVATTDDGCVQFRFLPDRRSEGLFVRPYRERRAVRRR
jgi:hypothetical protein